jgi:hypothetical protein
MSGIVSREQFVPRRGEREADEERPKRRKIGLIRNRPKFSVFRTFSAGF